MRYVVSFALVVAVVVAVLVHGLGQLKPIDTTALPALRPQEISIDGTTLSVLIADTPALQELGLGNRDSLPQDEGMLFVFPQDGQYAFWMKDMHFSIDMLWIDSSGKIIYIAPNVSPSTYPETFEPSQPARYVLETNAGFAAAHGIEVGDMVRSE